MQNKGVPMGHPLGRFFADLVLENLIESEIKKHPRWGPIIDWVRMIDDTFLEWLHSDQDFTEFVQFLNGLHPTIQWTFEKEKDGTFNFLDVLIIRNQDSLHSNFSVQETLGS